MSKRQLQIYRGALTMQDAQIKDVTQSFTELKYFITMDTVIDQKELQLMANDGFTNKPVCISYDKKNIIVGYLVAKTLLGCDYGKTLKELFQSGQACVKLPIYTSPDKPVTDVIRIFEKDETALCIVMKNDKQASDLTKFAKTYHTEKKDGTPNFNKDDIKPEAKGFFTFENVIKRLTFDDSDFVNKFTTNLHAGI